MQEASEIKRLPNNTIDRYSMRETRSPKVLRHATCVSAMSLATLTDPTPNFLLVFTLSQINYDMVMRQCCVGALRRALATRSRHNKRHKRKLMYSRRETGNQSLVI